MYMCTWSYIKQVQSNEVVKWRNGNSLVWKNCGFIWAGLKTKWLIHNKAKIKWKLTSVPNFPGPVKETGRRFARRWAGLCKWGVVGWIDAEASALHLLLREEPEDEEAEEKNRCLRTKPNTFSRLTTSRHGFKVPQVRKDGIFRWVLTGLRGPAWRYFGGALAKTSSLSITIIVFLFFILHFLRCYSFVIYKCFSSYIRPCK